MRVRRPWRPPSLRDVAELCGVSKATASRALSPQGSGVREEVRSQLRTAATRLGYYGVQHEAPHLLVLASDVLRNGYSATLSGVMRACQDLDVDMSVHVLTRGDDAWLRSLPVRGGRVDGLVILEFDSPSVGVLSKLPVDMPVAIAGGYPQGEHRPGQPSRAWTDDYAGAVLATEHLLSLGHTQIVYIGVPPAGHPDSRLAAWRAVMTRQGLRAPEPLVIGWGVATGRRAAPIVLSSGASAVLCGNDELALGLMAGLTDLGARVPDDVSVVGIDDHPHAAVVRPALTTVRLDFAMVGELAARMALGHCQEAEVSAPVELVVRSSTARPRRRPATGRPCAADAAGSASPPGSGSRR
nr:LacI family DNA-binding transcriptional regulator [Actinomyces sp.]